MYPERLGDLAPYVEVVCITSPTTLRECTLLIDMLRVNHVADTGTYVCGLFVMGRMASDGVPPSEVILTIKECLLGGASADDSIQAVLSDHDGDRTRSKAMIANMALRATSEMVADAKP